ncbi:type I restriction endonuclease subunit R [Hymenobacter crusticola]|uniref:Type I restriction enzyme endonuclease subunit n=1 Tax=Hymenobacter crusticola TaxID=1770526 RepID=A0A243W629_9BACT|nr:HsdR family type I site-specific deoxyribonuclease [Hymenobacter crusticola]OUJ69395.1 deoxyribonuclease HsdR [Hymenobacter crusticola]
MSEWSAVQEPMLNYAQAIGWVRLEAADAEVLRGGPHEPFFTKLLTDQLLKLNPGVLDAARAADVVRRLRLLPATLEGNREALSWMRGERSVYVPAEKRERSVRVIDFDNASENLYHVTPEWRHQGTRYLNRADVVYLINGLPVAVSELKNAAKKDGIAEGITQVRRYHQETPEMMLWPQVFGVSELLALWYGATWSHARKNIHNWKDDAPEAISYEQKVRGFFAPERVLRVLREYVLFLEKEDVLTKVLLRQHQTTAVEKAVARAQDPERHRGLLWHTQGSGKTLTMIGIARHLLARSLFGEKPTVLLLLDRNELESQTVGNLEAAGFHNPRVARTKRDMQQLLTDDNRGLIVAMIHKFDDIPASLNLRRSIVVLVDEAHRTTGGDLGTYLLAALPNATFLGFTGTPVDNLAHGRGTFKVFGSDDEQGYLHKYSIGESIADGTTVRLHYQLAPSELRVDRATLEKEFLSLTEAEGVADQAEVDAILSRAVTLKEMLKAPGRVAQIANFVAEHFQENVQPLGYKAFLVAPDREGCVFYKQGLDKLLPPEYSTVVISAAHNDDELLKQYYLTGPQEKDVRKAFLRRNENPQILIVTEKLLTGFDAPLLYCLYLDKPMRDHVLLQTIARVNRPYEVDGQEKPCGLVIDFVGIFERLEKALAFDSDVVASVIENVDVLKDLFRRQLADPGANYLVHARGWNDKDKERAITAFADKEVRKEFFRYYRQLSSLYEILSPDAFLRPYLKDYEALGMLYVLIRNAYASTPYVDQDLTAKTRALLRQHTSVSALELPNQIHVLGPNELALLKDSEDDDHIKVLNLRKALATAVDAERDQNPFVVGIGERAESLAQLYEDRQLTTQEVLAAFVALTQEKVNGSEEQKNLGLDGNQYAIFGAVRTMLPTVLPAQALALDALFRQYPHAGWDSQQTSNLRSALYKALLPLIGAGKMIELTTKLLMLKRVPVLTSETFQTATYSVEND